MNNHGMSLGTKVALWVLAAGVLSCNVNAGSEAGTRSTGWTHTRSSGGSRSGPGPGAAAEQWTTSTPMGQQTAVTEAAMGRMQSVVYGVQTAKVKFVNCEGPCVTRLQANNVADARALLKSVSASYQGRIGFTAREVLDPYTGRSFQLDVVLDSDTPKPVPETDDELIAGEP
jgi:hypothetical protein